MTEFDNEKPPEAIVRDQADASVSTELPVVILGDDDPDVSGEVPRVRLLQGRVHEAWILYLLYLLDAVAGALAVTFALTTMEWSVVPIALAWFLLFVWHWFYGVAYRYRRRLLKYTSVFVVFAMTVALAYFAMERAAPQRAMVASHEVVRREGVASLYWAAVATLGAGLVFLVHLVFLGRGYRKKRTTGWSPF